MDVFFTIFLVLLNGFFVAAEFAIVKVRLSQIEIKAKSGSKSAILSKHILNHLNGYLAATQLGITLASLGLGWIGEPVVSKLILQLMHFLGIEINPTLAHDIALPIAFAIITILHIVFGELAPKSVAIQSSEKTTLLIAYPLQLFYFVFRPFIWVLNGIANAILKVMGINPSHDAEVHSSDELKYLVKQGKDEGIIEENDYNIIKNAFNFSERMVKHVMVMKPNVVAININKYNQDDFERIIDEGYSRIPCYEDVWDNIVGVIYLKDLLLKIKRNETFHIRDMMRPVIIVPESKKIGSLLKEFQQKHQQLAIVINEYGGVKGMVTMEDILEELVGEIQDEYDNELPVVEKVSDKNFTVTASSSLVEINRLLPHPIIKDGQFETLAGKLMSKFGRIPNSKDKIVFDDYEITILKKLKHSIILVQLHDLKEVQSAPL